MRRRNEKQKREREREREAEREGSYIALTQLPVGFVLPHGGVCGTRHAPGAGRREPVVGSRELHDKHRVCR